MEELPCPQRIPFDSGVAFSLGIVLGSMWNSIKGFREHPSRRWFGVKKMVRQNAPRLGGNFAAWGTLFSISECVLVTIRGEDDFINRIISGATTSSLLAIRHGRGAMVRGAVIGGTLLGLIEGVTFGVTRMMSVDPSLYESEEKQQEQRDLYEQELKRKTQQMKAQQAASAKQNSSETSYNTSPDYSVDVSSTTEFDANAQRANSPSGGGGGIFARRSNW